MTGALTWYLVAHCPMSHFIFFHEKQCDMVARAWASESWQVWVQGFIWLPKSYEISGKHKPFWVPCWYDRALMPSLWSLYKRVAKETKDTNCPERGWYPVGVPHCWPPCSPSLLGSDLWSPWLTRKHGFIYLIRHNFLCSFIFLTWQIGTRGNRIIGQLSCLKK